LSEEKSPNTLRHLRNLFITGLLVLVPLGVTLWIVYSLFNLTDRAIRNMLTEPFNRLCQYIFNRDIEIPPYGIGLIVTVLVILFTGMIAKNLVGRRIISLFEHLLFRLPLVNRIYKAVKQISEAMLQRDKNIFQAVVLLEYPRLGLYSIGFVTSTTVQGVSDKINPDSVAVFVATTPNPTSGFVLIVPRRDVIFLDMTVEDAMKFVISGGVVTPAQAQTLSLIEK